MDWPLNIYNLDSYLDFLSTEEILWSIGSSTAPQQLVKKTVILQGCYVVEQPFSWTPI